MNKLALIAPVVAIVLAGAKAAHAETTWVPVSASTCDLTCSGVGKSAVVSGKYMGGAPFYVCAADYLGEGFRPGYNLFGGQCFIASHEKEIGVAAYLCLCQ
jgi:hypothetical protein